MDSTSNQRGGRAARAIRGIVEGLCLALIALAVFRAWCVEGIPVVWRVEGASMAPAFLGQHVDVACERCAYQFACDARHPIPGGQARCPNCGYAENSVGNRPTLLGDGLLIDRAGFAWRGPRRWEAVVLRHPGDADRLSVKRVVGLPGERVEIRDGDVHIDGRVQSKPYVAQRAVAILVHDADYQSPAGTAPSRWQPARPDSQWGHHGGRFACAFGSGEEMGRVEGLGEPRALGESGEDGPSPDVPPTPPHDGRDWLVYRHRVRAPGPEERLRPGPISDRYAHNQGRPRREDTIHGVRDVMVEFQIVDTWGPGSLSVELTDGHARLEVRFWPSDERFELLLDGQPIPNAENRFGGSLDGRRVVVSLFDRQLLVAVDDQVLGRLPIPTGDAPAEPPAEPIRIGVQVLGVILEGLRLYRDVYYTHPIGVRGRWALGKPAKLGDGEVFVLGDNSPIADDSRTWPEGPGIDVRTLVGRPMILWFRPMPARWGSWDFQVPDPTQIRYIP